MNVDGMSDNSDVKKASSNDRIAKAWHGGLPSAQEREVLDKRAELIQRRDDADDAEKAALKPYIAIELADGQRYGIAYDYLEEIIPDVKPSPVPCVASHIVGITSRQGELLTVVDLAAVVGSATKAKEKQQTGAVVVVQHLGVMVGLWVHEVIGYDEYDPKTLRPPIGHANQSGSNIHKGIWGSNTTILNVQALLSDPALVVDDHHRQKR